MDMHDNPCGVNMRHRTIGLFTMRSPRRATEGGNVWGAWIRTAAAAAACIPGLQQPNTVRGFDTAYD